MRELALSYRTKDVFPTIERVIDGLCQSAGEARYEAIVKALLKDEGAAHLIEHAVQTYKHQQPGTIADNMVRMFTKAYTEKWKSLSEFRKKFAMAKPDGTAVYSVAETNPEKQPGPVLTGTTTVVIPSTPLAKARASEAASKEALKVYCEQNGWRVVFFEGKTGAPRTGIIDAVAFRLARKNADALEIHLIQLKGGQSGISGSEIARLKKAVREATVNWMIAAYDGEVLHVVPE
jgi:hypothetical protein